MKEISLIIILIQLLSFNVLGQEKHDRGYVGFSFGISQPLGSAMKEQNLYTSLSFQGSPLGIEGGFTFSGSFAYELGHGMGFAATVQRTGLRSGFHSDKLRNWVIESALGGPFFSYKVKEDAVYIDGRVLFGYAKMQTPVYGKDKGYVTLIEEGSGFSYLVGAGLRIPFTKRLALLLLTDYFSAKPIWEKWNTTEPEPISTINLQLGFAGRLRK